MIKNKMIQAFIGIITVFTLAGCQSATQTTSDVLQVKTTVYPVTYLVEAIGGDAVEVASILPAGADAHDYEPTQQEIISLGESDAFFYIGIGDQELLVDELTSVLSDANVEFINVAANVSAIEGEAHTHDEETEAEHEEDHAHDLSEDPHIWLDPQRMAEMANIVYETLVQELPEVEAQLTANYTSIVEKLETLDENYTTALAEITNKHTLVTHNAYGYWEERYGLEIIALSDLTNSAELTQQEIIAISEQIATEGVKTLFVAPNIQSNYTTNFVNQFSLAELELQNLETLSAEEIAAGEDYFTVMNANLEALVTGLAE
ncbi:MAG: metal ABC transporter solute-binding protein, Zn/Mn family [Culicoidibacterales bacterium]